MAFQMNFEFEDIPPPTRTAGAQIKEFGQYTAQYGKRAGMPGCRTAMRMEPSVGYLGNQMFGDLQQIFVTGVSYNRIGLTVSPKLTIAIQVITAGLQPKFDQNGD